MTAPVDVLAVLGDYSAQHGDPEDFVQARAVIAELIEAAKRIDAVSRGADEFDEDNVVKAVHRLRAALACVGGAK